MLAVGQLLSQGRQQARGDLALGTEPHLAAAGLLQLASTWVVVLLIGVRGYAFAQPTCTGRSPAPFTASIVGAGTLRRGLQCLALGS